METMAKWWQDHTNLARLYRWLDDRGDAPDDVAYFMSKPWKWDPEWQRMTANDARQVTT